MKLPGNVPDPIRPDLDTLPCSTETSGDPQDRVPKDTSPGDQPKFADPSRNEHLRISAQARASATDALSAGQYLRLLHPARRRGKATIARKPQVAGNPQSTWTQEAVSIRDLPNMAASLEGMPDVYVTPNAFWGERHTERLVQICAAYSDLDYYNMPDWRDRDPETVMHAALNTLKWEKIPLPSLVLFSGHGLLLLWLHSPLPPKALPRWRALQKRIFSVLTPFGADAKARDVTRVFRVVGSVHRETGETVRLLWSFLPIASLDRLPFETLFERAMPLTRQELTERRTLQAQKKALRHQCPSSGNGEVVALDGRRAEVRAGGKGPAPAARHTGQTYWRSVLTDLHRLRQHRHRYGLLSPGQRNNWIFVAAVALSWTSAPEGIMPEVTELARRFAGWSEAEAKSCIASTTKRAKEVALGKTGTFNGNEVDLRYRFQAKTIVEWLAITEAEMLEADLRVLISPEVAKKRARERQQAHRFRNGAEPRAIHDGKVRAEAIERAQEILALLEELGTIKAIAEHLDIHKDTAKQRVRRARLLLDEGEGTASVTVYVAKPGGWGDSANRYGNNTIEK